MHRPFVIAVWLIAGIWGSAAGVLKAEPALPTKPARHFTDQANVVPKDAGERINAKLEQFERDTSNQVLVAIFRKLPADTYLEDYTVKTAEAWGAGGKERDNGIILFVFVDDRKMRIEVGYGLEGAVPDSIAAAIIRDVLKPRFREGRFAEGIDEAVDAIFKATRGEYTGSGRLRGESSGATGGGIVVVFFILGWIVLVTWLSKRRTIRQRHSRSYGPAWWGPPTGGGFGGWSSSGGGSFGGGFSGGGGSFGGGGASGDW